MALSRRAFLSATGILAGTLAIPLIYQLGRERLWASWRLRPLVLSEILSEEALRHIGATYRAQFPAEDSAERLMAMLREGAAASSAHDFVTPEDFERLSRQDFADNRVVIIDGWVLSVTEAQQCALLSL